MKLHRSKGSVRALLFCLVLVLTTPSPMVAVEAWSVDMAQMLMAEEWDLGQRQETAVVGYVIHLVEVERSIAKALSGQLELESKESPGLWLVSGDGFSLQVKRGSPLTWSAQSKVYVGQSQQAVSLDSWLLTLDGQPLRVDVTKTKVPSDPHGSSQEQLEIVIFPKKVQEGRIESEIRIGYETFAGTKAQVITTQWVGPEAERPVAVVSRKAASGRQDEYQYFAVYVAGTLIPQELLPNDAPVLAFGSIGGVEQFLEVEPQERRWSEVGVSLSRCQEEWGWQVDGSIYLTNRQRIYGQVGSLPQTNYRVGAEGALNPDLHLVAELAGGALKDTRLRLGLRDEVRLGERLLLSASLLPVTLDLGSWKPGLALDWAVRAEFSEEKFGLWYQVEQEQKVFRHSVGAAFFPKQAVGARVSWTFDGEGGSVFLIGLQVRF